MDKFKLLTTRRSVRTFDGQPLSAEDVQNIREYIENIPNPYGIPVKFVYLDAKEMGLSSPVITGEAAYIAGIVEKVPHREEAFGFSFERMVMHLWSRGIGTTWIAGTFKREFFEKAAGVKENEVMYCVTPVGYPAKKKSIKEVAMRKGVGADKRKDGAEIFFEGDFTKPFAAADEGLKQALEAVRWAPSAVNKQPWRIVKNGNEFHFYLKHDKNYATADGGDLQKVDMGIALCHFIDMTGGSLNVADPGIEVPEGIEYIASVTV